MADIAMTAALAKALGGGGGGVTSADPASIQNAVAAGNARKHFEIGDIITIPWTNFTGNTPVMLDLPFVVANIADCYDEDGQLHKDALWLMLQQAEPEEMVFDEPEVNAASGTFQEGLHYFTKNSDNSYTEQTVTVGDTIPAGYYVHQFGGSNGANIILFGYNRWSVSAYRQWLNSDAAKNENWWTKQHDFDVTPSTTYTNKPGWLFGFPDEWKQIFKRVKVQTAANTVTDGGVADVTYDKFFLPSLEQMYGSPQAEGVEGDFWPYWKEATGLDAPSNGDSSYPNDARKIPNIQSGTKAAVYVRLRSAYRGSSYYVWLVSTGGYLSYGYAYYACRSQPACVIY